MAVSAVINGRKSTVGVSEATKQRILEALQELQYQPHAMARSLKQYRTDNVAFYGFGHINTQNPYIRDVFLGLHEGLRLKECDMLLFNEIQLKSPRDILDRLLSNKIDGAVVLTSANNQEIYGELAKSGKPILLIADPSDHLPSVAADDVNGSKKLAELLLSKGHKRILYRRAFEYHSSDERRFHAFKSVIEAAGGTIIESKANDLMDTLTESDEQYLLDRSSKDSITAVAAWTDNAAVRALKFCHVNGISVPEDIAICGFDGLPLSELPQNRILTTVQAYWFHIARTAAELIIDLIDEKPIPHETIIPGDIVLGNTV